MPTLTRATPPSRNFDVFTDVRNTPGCIRAVAKVKVLTDLQTAAEGRGARSPALPPPPTPPNPVSIPA